jgi:hypothetical protein
VACARRLPPVSCAHHHIRGAAPCASLTGLYIRGLQVAVASALFLACGMVAQYRSQRAAASVSAPRGVGGGAVELLTFEMLHDPQCKADKHCRSACRMVCDEVHSGQGAREHAATLISFGCCLSAPVITKQRGAPAQLKHSPLQLMAHRGPATEEMLFQVNAQGHVKFDRPAENRKDSIAVHVLRDRHSLAADLKDLEREQAALARRVSKLKIRDVLPFKVAKGQKLVRRGSKHPGKLYPEGPGSTDPYYDEEDKLPDMWEEPECDLPLALKGKVNCTIGKKRKKSDTDPNGVERQAEMKGKHEAKWVGHTCTGQGCPEEDSGWKEYDKFRAYLQASNRYGLAGEFKNGTGWDEGHYSRATGVYPFGTAWESPEPSQWCGSVGNGSFQLNVYECYRHCHWHAGEDVEALENCAKNLTFAHKQYEWIHKPGCVPNVTIDASNGMGLDEVEYPYGVANVTADTAASCLELIPVRTMYDYGHSVANGSFPMQDMEDEMDKVTPSDDAIKAYLGDDLFHEYEREDRQHLPYGQAHMRLQVGQHRIRKLANFKKAYGGKTEYEWCLEQHKNDRDFPQACTGDGKEFAGRPWQARHKPRTAPEEAVEGIAYAIRNLIGYDHRERVVPKTGAEAVGQTHTNKFEYGAVTVQPGHVAAEPAPWLRNRGMRYMPQSYESKSVMAHEARKLPGITIDSWGGGVPMAHHSLRDPITYTPNSCCSHFVEYSEWA